MSEKQKLVLLIFSVMSTITLYASCHRFEMLGRRISALEDTVISQERQIQRLMYKE